MLEKLRSQRTKREIMRSVKQSAREMMAEGTTVSELVDDLGISPSIAGCWMDAWEREDRSNH